MTNRITTKKTDWAVYKREIKKKEDILRTKNFQRSCMQERYKIIIEIIKNAVKEATNNNENKNKTKGVENNTQNKEEERKLERNNNFKNPVSWWDEECRIVIEKRKKKLKRYQETLSLPDFIEYKKYRAIARKTIKQKKKENFKRFYNKS